MPRFGHLRIILVACAALFASCCAGLAQGASTGDSRTIVFVCLHGVVNSQMAAAYFNKAAKERGLPYTAISRGIDLHSAIPVRVLDGLALDGLDPANSPRALTPADANGATEVLAFDAVPAERSGQASVTYWSACRLASTTTTRHGTRSSGASTICFRP
jgi:protein-tyrosine-phosphatase